MIRTCLGRRESLGRASREEFPTDFRLAEAQVKN